MAKRNPRGMGTRPYQVEGKAGWYLAVSLGKKADGTRNRKTLHADTANEVIKLARTVQKEKDDGKIARSGKMTLGQWTEKWLAIRPGGAPGRYAVRCTVRLH